ncbi:MAG: hypothetical protein V4547_10590, partial [Bacteroidota bacterium]
GVTSVGNAATVVTNANLTGGVTSVGNAATVVTNANLTGDITSVGNATTLTNAPVIAKVLTGYVSGAGTVAATDNILQAIQKLNGNNATNANLTGGVTSVGNAATVVTNANLTGGVTSVGNAATVVTNANLTGDITSVGNATTLTNAPVIAKVLTGYVSGAGTVAATDNILQAIQKLNGNDANNAPLASPTFTGTPTMPTGTIGVTQAANDSTTKLATTAFVDRAIGSDWKITGNAGTGGANFLGTTDNKSLRFRTNNTQKVIVDSLGNMGIGIAAPIHKLHVKDNGQTGTHVFGVHTDDSGPWAFGIFNDSYSSTVPAFEGFAYNSTSGNYVTGDFLMGSPAAKKVVIYTNGNANARLTIDGAGLVGIGTTTPTAILHLKAGTAAANTAPLKFTSGTLLTTAEAGTVEFLTDAWYATITTGAARKTFAFLESPTFTGTPTMPTGTIGITQAANDSTTKLATTAFVDRANANLAPLASPTFTGTPTMPTGTIGITQAANDSTTKLATTAFVDRAIGDGYVNLTTNQLSIAGSKGFTSDLNAHTVKVGLGAGSISTNTAIGVNVLDSNTTGSLNTHVGYQSGFRNFVGVYNTGLGYRSLYFNKGDYNTGLGLGALQNNSTGSQNTSVGMNSQVLCTTGTLNTSIGLNSLRNNLTGSRNIGLGYEAGQYETGSNAFYVHNGLGVSDLATGKTNSLLYGIFNATAANQTLTINGNVGIGTITPTALLHLKAGTAAANTAPLKFTSGTLLTTPVAGTVEFLTDGYYATITTGAARKTFAFLESPTFTGTPTSVTPAVNDSTTKLATTAFVDRANANLAPLASPTFTTSAISPLWTNTGAMDLTTTGSDGDITLTPNGVGSVVVTSGVTGGSGLYVGNSLLTNGRLVDIVYSGTTATAYQRALNVETSGNNSASFITTVGSSVNNTHTGTNSYNVGGAFYASGGTYNYGLLVGAGNVGIGTSSPTALLDISSSNTTGVTTSSAVNLAVNSLTTGTGVHVSSSSSTSGQLMDLQSTSTAVITAATVLNINATGTPSASGLVTYGAKISNVRNNATSGTNEALWLNANNALTQNVALHVKNGNIIVDVGRVESPMGVSVASATNMTLGEANSFHITGTTTIQCLIVTNWQAGSMITLIFDGAALVKNNGIETGGKKIRLAGAVDWTSSANDVLTLIYDGISWFECSRSIN